MTPTPAATTPFLHRCARTSTTTLLASATGVAVALAVGCGSAERPSFEDDARTGEATFADGGDPGQGKTAACVTARSAAQKTPVDVIVVVDQSASMYEEIEGVKASINVLSLLLASTHIDYRFVVIGRTGTSRPEELCVPPPLGGAGCGANGDTFRPVSHSVESHDALPVLLSTAEVKSGRWAWRDVLRPEALKVIIPVSDDEAGISASDFDAQFLAKGHGLFGTASMRRYVVYPIAGAETYPSEAKCATAVTGGSIYVELAKLTKGKWFPVCSPSFAPVFEDLGKTLASSIACSLAVPPDKLGEVDRSRVNVRVTSSDGRSSGIVQDATRPCDAGADGWQFSSDGSSILLCGSACGAVRADGGSTVEIELGCTTRIR